jgi:hypothetical protein
MRSVLRSSHGLKHVFYKRPICHFDKDIILVTGLTFRAVAEGPTERSRVLLDLNHLIHQAEIARLAEANPDNAGAKFLQELAHVEAPASGNARIRRRSL